MRTAEEIEKEEQEDERNAGCFLQSLGCLGEGCLTVALPFAIAFIWLLS